MLTCQGLDAARHFSKGVSSFTNMLPDIATGSNSGASYRDRGCSKAAYYLASAPTHRSLSVSDASRYDAPHQNSKAELKTRMDIQYLFGLLEMTVVLSTFSIYEAADSVCALDKTTWHFKHQLVVNTWQQLCQIEHSSRPTRRVTGIRGEWIAET